MRLVIVIAAALTMSAGPTPAAGSEPGPLVQKQSSDLSAAKKKPKKKAAPKEQYLRAVPSAPPPGAKK